MGGIQDALSSATSIRKVSIVELNRGRAKRLNAILEVVSLCLAEWKLIPSPAVGLFLAQHFERLLA